MAQNAGEWVVEHWSRFRPGGGVTIHKGYDSAAEATAKASKLADIGGRLDPALTRQVRLTPDHRTSPLTIELSATRTDRFGREDRRVDATYQVVRTP